MKKEIDKLELVRFIMPFVALVAIVTCILVIKIGFFPSPQTGQVYLLIIDRNGKACIGVNGLELDLEKEKYPEDLVVGDVIRFKAPTSGSRAVEIMEIVRKGEFKDPEIKRLGTSSGDWRIGSRYFNTTLAPFGADLEMDVFAMEVDGPRPYLVTNVYQGQELPLRRRGFYSK